MWMDSGGTTLLAPPGHVPEWDGASKCGRKGMGSPQGICRQGGGEFCFLRDSGNEALLGVRKSGRQFPPWEYQLWNLIPALPSHS